MGIRGTLINGVAVFVACGLIATQVFAQDRVVRNFEPGSQAFGLGIVEASPDTEIEGPQAIFSSENGDLYVLDQVNGRVLRMDPSDPGKEPEALDLPEGLHPTDLVVSNGSVYVFDGQIHALQPSGAAGSRTRSLSMSRSIAGPDEATVSAFAQMGSVDLPPENDAAGVTRSLGKSALLRSKQTVLSHGAGQVVAELSSQGESAVEIAMRARSGESFPKLKLNVSSRLGSVEVLDVDTRRRTFVLAENVPTDMGGIASSFVARYGSGGALEGVYELPLDSSVALSRRFVTVSPEGDVFFLRTRKGAADVLGVGFRPVKPGQPIGVSGPQMSLRDFAKIKGAKGAVRQLTRAQVVETAFAFANARWRVNAGAYGSDPDRACTGFNRIRRPGYLSGKLNQDVVGIPYCWGCHGSLAQISTAFDRGMLAGNVCTRNDPRRDVAGVDCSAFVSACWGLATHFTTIAIPAISQPVSNPWDMLPGDALNKAGSHVMLFVRFTPDRKVEVIESSTGGCNGKVCRNIYPLGSLLARGYKPVRYRGLVGDMSAPAEVATISKVTPQGKTKGR